MDDSSTNSKPHGAKKKIAVLRLSSLGDCINAFGFIGGLKKAYPKLKISWVIDKRFSPLFHDHDKDELVPMYELDFKKHGMKALFKFKKELKDKKFDLLFNIQTSFKASLTSLCIRADVKYGYDSKRAREGQTLFTDVKVPSPEDPHVLKGFLAFAEAAGFENVEPYWDFNLQDVEIDYARSYFESNKIFLIAPASAKPQKNWTVEGYTALGRYAMQKGYSVGLLGGSGKLEQALCQAIDQNLDYKCVNLCGRTSLRELLAVTAVGSLLLSPDSGTMHLASALNTPVIGLFAIHNEKRVGPWNYPDLCVSVYEELAKKELNGAEIPWRYRVRDEKAMEKISIERVKQMFDYAEEKYLSGINKQDNDHTDD